MVPVFFSYGTIKTVPLFCGYGTVNFFVSFFYAHKRPSPFFYTYPTKNDQCLVADIFLVQLNQTLSDFRR